MDAYKGRIFRRLENIDLKNFNFSHVLVDPPRSGLSHNVTEILNKFENIIYISCNPDTFKRDLDKLKDYRIKKLEVFDQFSNTPHLELIALLIKR
jgi:tRNA (uracil-5-)-methyltransferase